jgi:hypothetical protein
MIISLRGRLKLNLIKSMLKRNQIYSLSYRGVIKDVLDGFDSVIFIVPSEEKLVDSPAYNVKASKSME